MEANAYGCCLPALTRFTPSHCAGDNLQHQQTEADAEKKLPRKGIRPGYGGLPVTGYRRFPVYHGQKNSQRHKKQTFRNMRPALSACNFYNIHYMPNNAGFQSKNEWICFYFQKQDDIIVRAEKVVRSEKFFYVDLTVAGTVQ